MDAGVTTGNGNTYAARLGRKMSAFEEAVAHTARTRYEADVRVFAESLARWTPIADALGRVVSAYNAGAGPERGAA